MKRRGDRPQHAHTLIRQISSRKRAQQHHCPHPNDNTNQSSANISFTNTAATITTQTLVVITSLRYLANDSNSLPPPQSHIIGHHSITPISQIPLF
ncbi:hypothetical protein niasHS_016601 [Heterodera schachtii]|uniref:Uncharacterized protein n=1 Tax=Heterodera schachtii TaxID=97005 RepID=A0ABD2HYM4_HETSC